MRALPLALLALAVSTPVFAAAIAYSPPEETAKLNPGPGFETAQADCMVCHSVDYISTQPRSFADPRAYWTAEVVKMRKAYGAPIPEADTQALVDYLVSVYGK